MSSQMVVSVRGQIVAFFEFADWAGEPNREFTQALAGDSTAAFGKVTAATLRDVVNKMFPGAEIVVTHATSKIVSKELVS